MKKLYFLVFVCGFLSGDLWSQSRTVGLTSYSSKGHVAGYSLFSPMVNGSNASYLIDDCGRLIKKWNTSGMPGTAGILGRDGSLIRTVSVFNRFMALGMGGIIEKYNWNGLLTWKFTLTDSNEALHHDIVEMPNGNILAIVWERHTADDAESRGRVFPSDRTDILSERIIEIQPIGKDSFDIVWEWRLWDHMVQDKSSSKPSYGVISAHPELIDINFYDNADLGRDWLHLNGIDYNESLDQIMITSRSLGEIYIIDHSTNVVQAAGHSGGRWGKGGDFLYRWGNPASYGRGSSANQKLFVPHHGHWIANGLPHAGKIMIFNNGQGRPDGNYSSVDMIAAPVDVNMKYTINSGQAFGPANPTVRYKSANPADFYAPIVSGSYMLPNGNLYTTYGTKGTLMETDSTGAIIWKYVSPVSSTGIVAQGSAAGTNTVFRYQYYPPGFSGFEGKDLTPGAEIETSPNPVRLCVQAGVAETSTPGLRIYPNPAGSQLKISGNDISHGSIYDMQGRKRMDFSGNEVQLDLLESGVYIINIEGSETHWRTRFVRE